MYFGMTTAELAVVVGVGGAVAVGMVKLLGEIVENAGRKRPGHIDPWDDPPSA
jgi:hypothetical protein